MCILLSHAPLNAQMVACAHNAREIEEIIDEVNSIRKGTVRLCINGHRHTDTFNVRNGVVYFDVNVVRSGAWMEKKTFHYAEGHGFEFADYGADGKEISREHMDYNALRQGTNTWFFDAPLSANVTFEGNKLIIEGTDCKWACGVAPDLNAFSSRMASGINTKISSHRYVFED